MSKTTLRKGVKKDIVETLRGRTTIPTFTYLSLKLYQN